jgi:hypothetical protein
MKRIAWFCALCVAALAVTASAQDARRAGAPKNIILFGWDGAQRAHVRECLQRGELPTLRKLSEEGALVDVDIVNGATDTKAGWSQILTGYNPPVTGVYSNARFDAVPKGLSIFERLENHFGADKFVTVAVIGKKGHCGEINPPRKIRLDDAGQPVQPKAKAGRKAGKRAGKQAKNAPQARARRRPRGRIIEENGVKYLVTNASPYYLMHKALEVWEFGLTRDEKVGTRALELLEKYKGRPFFFFVHFAEVDHSGHKHGENSKQYNDALISNDTWTGRIVAKLKELGLYDQTLLYVTADHGFDEGAKRHSYAPYVFLGTNDPQVKRAGMRQDVAPTILARFGLDLAKLDPALDGEPLTKAAVKPVRTAPEKKPAAGKRRTRAKKNPA